MTVTKRVEREAAPLLVVGPSPEAIEAARGAILDIINTQPMAGVSEGAIIAALDTLRGLCRVKNVTISNCTLTG